MNPLLIIEPAHTAAAVPSLLKEEVAAEGALVFATLVDVVAPLPARSPMAAEIEKGLLAPAVGFAEGDPDSLLAGSDAALPVADSPLLTVTPEARQTKEHFNPADMRQANPVDPGGVAGAKRNLNEAAPVLPSAPPAKGARENVPPAVAKGLSTAQAAVEGRFTERPQAAAIKSFLSQDLQHETRADAAKLPSGEGRQQPPAAAALQPGTKLTVPAMPVASQPAMRGRDQKDPAIAALPAMPLRSAQPLVPGSFVVASQPATAMVQGLIATGADLTEPAVKTVEQELAQSITSQDRPIASSQTNGGGVAPAGAETARHAAHQIATAIIQGNGKATEIALNPEELGRVRLTLSAADGALTLVVLADRPETQELLRRHIDVLGQEFRSMGYDSVSFSFNADGGTGSADHSDGSSEDIPAAMMPSAETGDAAAAAPAGGLDLRL